jgi:toxin ParE1/3/4
MKLLLHRADEFNADFDRRYRWYLREAGEEVAERFLRAVPVTLSSLAQQPNLGLLRNFRHPLLRDLRSFHVERPFQKTLIFYRVTDTTIEAWRLMHGARNLTRRLIESLS